MVRPHHIAFMALVLALPVSGCNAVSGWLSDGEEADSTLAGDPAAEGVRLDSVLRQPAEGPPDPALDTPDSTVAPAATDDSTVATSVEDTALSASARQSADTVALPGDSADAVAEALQALAVGQAALAGRLDALDQRLAAPPVVSTPQDSTGSETADPDTTALGGAADAAGQVLGEARDRVRSFGVGVVWSLLVLILFHFTIRGMVWVLDTLAERSAKRRLFYKRLVPIIRIILWLFAAYLIIRVIFRVDASGILAATAAVGVAVGFAAQDLLKNLFGGIILVFDQPFQVGDKISVGGTYGEVVSIGLRSTRLVTADDNLVSVPNALMVDGQVANANAGELNCQVVTDLYLPGFVDEAQAKKIAFGAAASSKYVFLNKPIVVLVKDEFKETFLTRIRVKAYVLDPRYEFLFQSDVTERARAGFREAGLTDERFGVRAWVDVAEGADPGEAES